MSKKNLVTPTTWAKKAGIQRTFVYQLMRPQQITPEDVGGKQFIDTDKYPPEQWKKKLREQSIHYLTP